MVRNDQIHHRLQTPVVGVTVTHRKHRAIANRMRAPERYCAEIGTPVSKSRAERCSGIKAVQRANNLYLICVLSQLGPEPLLNAAGLRSSLPTGSKVYVRALNEPGVHPAGVVHLSDGELTTSLFAKVQKADYAGVQNLERELHFLSNVAPLITAENPMLRSPLPIAYYPENRLLLMEFVPGNSLKHHLFDVIFNPAPRRNLPELLQCAGRWLGSLHRLTRKNTTGNPLQWILQEFENQRTLEAFRLFSLKDSYTELHAILEKCLNANPTFRRNLCDIHGEFTPIHVMVAGDAIYIVDFGNSREGYVYEDVGLFESFYDCLLPWRAAAGSYRINLQTQKQLFLHGYFDESATIFSPADSAIMRWVRLISFARMLNGGQRRYSGWSKWAYSRIALGALRNRFARLCRTELSTLREMRPTIFEEEAYSEKSPIVPSFAHSGNVESSASA
jgi:tRNA A-37 threonylcarbamoyl transferase component Bud32